MKRLLCALLLLASLAACSGAGTPDPTSTPAEGAWYACTLFVRDELGVPTSDAQRYAPGNVTETAADTFQVDIYYANENATYRCEILHRTDGNWELLDLQVR